MVLPHFSTLQNPNEKSGIDVPEKYVLHFGRIAPEKGIDRLLKIFQDLLEINLYLAGNLQDGFQIPELPNVKYVGFQSPKKLERLIKNSLIIVSTSTLWETFGLIASEAMLNGKPFIGFSEMAFGEIVENNRSGFLVKNDEEMKEKIRLLIKDEGLRILFGRNALERAQIFSSENYYSRLMAIFRELIKS